MKKYLILLFIPLAFLLTGCQNQKTEKTDIVTSFYPTYVFTKAIVGNEVSVKNILPPNQEVHDFEPSAKEMATMTDSKVFIYNDNNLEKWAGQVNNKGIKIEAAADVNKIETDPHTWLSPKEAIVEVKTIAKGLEEQFPEHKLDFEKNAAVYITKLEAIDRQYEQLKTTKERVIITQHDAFSYLARDYGLTAIPITGLDPESEPSGATLAELKNKIQQYHVTTVFSENNSSNKLADALAKEANVKVIGLNTMEIATNQDLSEESNYLTDLQSNLKILESTLNQ